MTADRSVRMIVTDVSAKCYWIVTIQTLKNSTQSEYMSLGGV